MSEQDRDGSAHPRVLVFMAYYLPGYKSGGALRTLRGIVETLGSELAFHVLTRDRDFQEPEAYPNVEPNEWNEVGPARVFYLSPKRIGAGSFRTLMRTTPHDLVYFPSFFDPRFTLLPLLLRRLRLVPRPPAVVAPQNELSPGALSIKASKKQIFLRTARALGLYRDVTFHASSELEREEIAAVFPEARIEIARNVLPPPPDGLEPRAAEKNPKHLKAIFLSRINTKKNLTFVLQLLADPALKGHIELDIFGPVDDPDHWAECETLIAALPDHVEARYRGSLENHRIPEVMPDYHLFVLPTLGESFGYAILEAMLWGCPVLISDRTPWTDLARQGAGWDLPLEEPERYLEVLARILALDQQGFDQLRKTTRSYALAYVKSQDQVDENRQLLLRARDRG